MVEPDYKLLMEFLAVLQKDMRSVKENISSIKEDLSAFREETNRRLEGIEKRQLEHSSDISSLRMEVGRVSEIMDNIGLAITRRK